MSNQKVIILFLIGILILGVCFMLVLQFSDELFGGLEPLVTQSPSYYSDTGSAFADQDVAHIIPYSEINQAEEVILSD